MAKLIHSNGESELCKTGRLKIIKNKIIASMRIVADEIRYSLDDDLIAPPSKFSKKRLLCSLAALEYYLKSWPSGQRNRANQRLIRKKGNCWDTSDFRRKILGIYRNCLVSLTSISFLLEDEVEAGTNLIWTLRIGLSKLKEKFYTIRGYSTLFKSRKDR